MDFDVIVVGGGPGGAATSALCAMEGHKVLLLERDKFPRYQIGESLLPSTVHGVCRTLGVSDEVHAAGFMRKAGGSFRWGKKKEPWEFNFAGVSELGQRFGYAFQVERAKFDDILLKNAARKGVSVREQHSVKEIIEEGGRVTGVRFEGPDGKQQTATAKFVVDAAGNQSRLHQHVGERHYSKFFQNVALFAYYENGKRMPDPSSGNILCAAFDEGWFWYIPLSPTLTSVGCVMARDQVSKLAELGEEAAMRGFIDRCPIIKDYLAPATRVTEGMYGQFRVRKDYSYCNTRFWKPGLVLVGDAACFIDPVFSSGVHLATYSAVLAARSINTLLQPDRSPRLDEEGCFTEFERRYLREFRNFYDFLLCFYDVNRDEDGYFWAARNVLHTEERSNEAFIRLVGGISSVGEGEDGSSLNPEDFLRKREGYSGQVRELFKAHTEYTLNPTAETASKRAQVLSSIPSFAADVLKQRAQLELEAEGKAPPEKPLFKGGFIASPSGLRWALAD